MPYFGANTQTHTHTIYIYIYIYIYSVCVCVDSGYASLAHYKLDEMHLIKLICFSNILLF